MCAALLGLIAVCSTMALPSREAAAAGRPLEPLAGEGGAVEEEVDVAVGRRLDAREAFDGPERGDDLLRDDARRLAEPSRQLECQRNGEVAERAARRGFNRNGGQRRIVGRDAVEAADDLGHAGADESMNRQNHELVVGPVTVASVVIRSSIGCGFNSINPLARS